jgi:hypothetical protein
MGKMKMRHWLIIALLINLAEFTCWIKDSFRSALPSIIKFAEALAALIVAMTVGFICVCLFLAFCIWFWLFSSVDAQVFVWTFIIMAIYLYAMVKINQHGNLFVISNFSIFNIVTGISLLILVILNHWDIYEEPYQAIFGWTSMVSGLALIIAGLYGKMDANVLRKTKQEKLSESCDKDVDNLIAHVLPKLGFIILLSSLAIFIAFGFLKPEYRFEAINAVAGLLFAISQIIWLADVLWGLKVLVEDVAEKLPDDKKNEIEEMMNNNQFSSNPYHDFYGNNFL